MITVEGKYGTKATVLAHSISPTGKEIITYEAEYGRIVLAETNTHRQLSRNSYSSRAVPFNKMVEQLKAEPVRFGANQAGMQDTGEDYEPLVDVGPALGFTRPYMVKPRIAWQLARNKAVKFSEAFYKAGYHKQVYNRLTETWQMQKTVISATELDNFMWLRDDGAADPTIAELARMMKEAKELSTPELLQPSEWHLPYIVIKSVTHLGKTIRTYHLDENSDSIDVMDAIKVSCARCAAVSYRNEGYGLEKSLEIYDRLVGSEKKHASAFEHCATPMEVEDDIQDVKNMINDPFNPDSWEEGITHVDRDGKLWSGNFQGWIQFRKLIPGECYSK